MVVLIARALQHIYLQGGHSRNLSPGRKVPLACLSVLSDPFLRDSRIRRSLDHPRVSKRSSWNDA